MSKRTLLMIVFSAGALLILLLLMARNPLNLFMEKSDNFSLEAFESIETGMHISVAVSALGGPVRIEVLGADYWRCPECSAYCFACNPPDWLIGYKEAWIYVGSDGLIRETFINTEP